MNTLYDLYKQHPCITTDSRDCPPGSIFIALHGDRFDGNQFALQALEKGCAYAVIDNEDAVAASHPSPLTSRLIKVPDTLQALKDIAREHRRQFDIPVIAITGTNGKTTTKELVRAVLSEKYNVLATEGNFNNDVGVPKTLLRLCPEHEIAIIEMGASHPGDIKTLVETAEPTCGIITNVGRAHLQGFGSFEGVCKTKGELYDFLRTRENGLVFVNADNDYLLDMLDGPTPSPSPEGRGAAATEASSSGEDWRDPSTLNSQLWITPYSTDPEKQYTCISGEIIREEGNPLLKLRWRRPLMDLEETGASQKWHKVQTQLIGDYNIDNVMAAIAVGINFGVDRKSICRALENYKPTNSRSQLVDTERNRLIVDAYNANPTSMMASLENFLLMPTSKVSHKDDPSPLTPHPSPLTPHPSPLTSHPSPLKKMAILGDMLELGPTSHEEHQRIVDYLEASGLAEVWLVGHEFGATTTTYRKFADVDEVKAHLQAHCPEGHLILIKGSNSTRLHQLPALL